MKTIKIIDLLNMISNDEEVPKFVQYYDIIDRETRVMLVCIESIVYKLERQKIHLNSRVEIIEKNKIEEKKLPEKLYFHDLGNITINEKILVSRINSILDYLESKEKGE